MQNSSATVDFPGVLEVASAPGKLPVPFRRRIDWRLAAGEDASRARLRSPAAPQSGLAKIASALLATPSPEAVDRALRETIELLRTTLHLERVSIFLLSPDERTMIGTWGTGSYGQSTDEHDIEIAVDELMQQFFAKTAEGYPWSIFENCPHLAHENGQTRILGRGWLACTVIPGRERPLGVLFNDTALGHGLVDEGKQARVAMLCGLLGRTLDRCETHILPQTEEPARCQHPLVRSVKQHLAHDPAVSFQELAQRLQVSVGYLTRTFKRHCDTSIVEYRNELRLARFLDRINSNPRHLLQAALAAGFGSYAQFHRVFRARFGQGPRRYLFAHGGAPAPEPPVGRQGPASGDA